MSILIKDWELKYGMGWQILKNINGVDNAPNIIPLGVTL